jgi:hypothetical protein
MIYWSWHIWVVNYDPNTGGTWTNNGFTFMDRNLGATEAALSLASWGLLYQWGRKDPFPGGKEGTAGYAALSRFKGMSDAGSKDRVDLNEITVYGGILESIRNPTTFYTSRSSYDWLPQPDDKLWNTTNDAKTVYDPCPAGWRVPLARADDENASPWHGIRWKKTDTPTDDWGYITSDGWVILNTKHRDQYGDPTTGAYYWCGDRSSKGWLYTPYRGYGEITHYSKALGNTVRCIKE